MPEPQPVLAPPATAAVFLVVTVAPGGEETVRDVLEDLPALQRAVGFGAPDDRLTCVASIGAAVWGRLFQGPRPAGLDPFRELARERHRAVATPGDVLFHVRSRRMDLCFELARRLCAQLGDAVAVADEVHGFKYYDMRDLLGFVDGTENPVGQAAGAAVFTGAEDPRFAGGSYVMVQKYLHDLDAWEALSTEEQERVIGRTRLGDTELYFIGYAREPGVLEEMPENMFLGRPPGMYDRILDFSMAVTGCLFLAPAADFPDDLPGLPTASRPEAAAARPDPIGGRRNNLHRQLLGRERPSLSTRTSHRFALSCAAGFRARSRIHRRSCPATSVRSTPTTAVSTGRNPASCLPGAPGRNECNRLSTLRNRRADGLRPRTSLPELSQPAEVRDYPDTVSQALSALRLAGVGGPYSLLLGADAYTAVSETADHGYPVAQHISRLLDGDLIWAPAMNGGLAPSTRGGDFELRLGEDLAIGYTAHDAKTGQLYLHETLTFLTYTDEAIVVLRA